MAHTSHYPALYSNEQTRALEHALAASLVESVTDKPADITVETWESWHKKEQ